MSRWRSIVVLGLSVLTGALLGCIFSGLVFASSKLHPSPFEIDVVAAGFLAGVPAAMGYLAVSEYLRRIPRDRIRWYAWLFLPWGSVVLTLLIAAAFGGEGRICILFAAPFMLVAAMFGGIVSRIVWARSGPAFPNRMSALAFPLVLMLIEQQIPIAPEIRTVKTEIMIHAPARVVWDNIKSVRLIRTEELPEAWVTRVGFPRPLAATLSHEGAGGVRQASFTGGLVFTETVNRWETNSDLRFSIRANTDSIPPSTLDQHVTIGGKYFDVLDGEYVLEPRENGVLLHLTSRERLSTHINPYAGMWTDSVMRAIQEQILVVIQKRCEEAGTPTKSLSAAFDPEHHRITAVVPDDGKGLKLREKY